MCNGRRKLVLGEGDLLAAVEPRFERRISIELGTPHACCFGSLDWQIRRPLGLDDALTLGSQIQLRSRPDHT